MASRTQLRLGQITGSLGDFEGGIIDTRSASAASSIDAITLNSGSLAGVFSEVVSSLTRIHGADTFASNANSVLKDINGDTRISYADGADTILNNDDASVTLTVGSNIEAAGTFVPDSNLGQDLGTSSVHWGTLHVGQVDATGLTGSVAGTGITNDQVVVSNNGTLEGDSNFTWNGTLLTLGGQSAGTQQLSVSGDATITGNLTVNGTTTTINTDSLVVEDSVIALSSGSAANADVNSALVFQRATADLGGGSDQQNGALMFLQGTGFKLGYTNDNAETAQGSLAIANDDLASVWVDRVNFAGNANYINTDAGGLFLYSAANFEIQSAQGVSIGLNDLNAKPISISDGGTERGTVTYDAQLGFVLSSSAGNRLTLDSNNGAINFAQEGGAGGTSVTAIELGSGTVNFGLSGTSGITEGFIQFNEASVQVISGSTGLKIDAGANAAQLQLVDATTNVLTIDVPTAVTAYTLTLPGAVGDSNQVLRLADGSGNLEFADISAAGNTSKQVLTLDANNTGIAADTAVSLNSGIPTSNVTYSGDNITALSLADTQGKVLDVFVNGQLLTSGSNAQITANPATADYEIASASTLKFGFDLEAFDVIQAIKRG